MSSAPVRLKILMVNLVNFEQFEGGTLHQLGLLRSWTKQGHDVRLIAPRRRTTHDLALPESERIHFSLSVSDLGLPRIFDSLPQIATVAFYRFFRGYRSLYLRANTMSFLVAAAARLMRMRVVVEHNSWSASERTIRGGGRFAALLEKRSQIWVARLSHVSRCVTPGIAELLAKNGVPREKLKVLGNGTDTAQFVPINREWALNAQGLDPACFWIGFLGLMSKWQGLETAVRAMNALRDEPAIRLILAGDGPERLRMEKMAHDFGLADRILFPGHINRGAANLMINCFDIAIAPFTNVRNSEIGLSAIKIRNYAAAGRTVVAPDLEGIREFSQVGWLFLHRPDEAEDLAAVILRLMRQSEAAPLRAEAARTYAEMHFEWDTVASTLISFLTRLPANDPNPNADFGPVEGSLGHRAPPTGGQEAGGLPAAAGRSAPESSRGG